MSTKIIDQGDIPIDLIAPNPEQPRQDFDQAGLEELAQSIREHGVIQPIVVERASPPGGGNGGGRYLLHTGERRWRAARLAGLETIPAIVVDESTPGDRLMRALIENVQRTDMTPLEIARAYARMHDELGMSDQRIADQVGKSRSSVANARRLLELPKDVLQMLATEENVSERQLIALLPLYQQLPPELLKKAESDWYEKPSRLIEEIRAGQATSDHIRRRVASIVDHQTLSLSGANFPVDHAFDAEGLKVRSPRCDQCPDRVKAGQEMRCPDRPCFDAKTLRWHADILQAASQASGILPLGNDFRASQVELFYSDSDLVEQILADGCENLRLRFDSWGAGVRLPGHEEHVRVVCHRTDGHCTCLSALRAQRTKADPEHIAERERKNQLQAEIVEPYTQALAQALADGHTGAWRALLASLNYSYRNKGQDWDLETIRGKLARSLVDNRLPYNAHEYLDRAREAVGDYFEHIGLAIPGRSDPAARLRTRLDRVRGWLDGLDRESVTLEQIIGNLANVEKITDEFDALRENGAHGDDEFLADLADLWEDLDTLKHQHMNDLLSVRTAQEEPA